jgi:hypothetical protein
VGVRTEKKRSAMQSKITIDSSRRISAETYEHSHNPDPTACELARIKHNIKRKSTTSQNSTQQILATELRNISETAAVQLTRVDHLKRTIRHQRQEAGGHLPNPRYRRDIPALPVQYQQTLNGEQFLVFDSGVGDDNRLIIFASQMCLRLLAGSDNWFCDGTFKVCPDVFYQLYTIHALVNGRVFPCVYGLLPNKTQNTYSRFFNEVWRSSILLIDPNASVPLEMLFDFEIGAQNAARTVFNGIDVKGCFFHLCSSIWKHVVDLGMKDLYINDPEFALHVRMISAIAFVPPANVIQAFEDLSDDIRNLYNGTVGIGQLLDYFEDNYIGRFRRNAPRTPPLFAIDLWNMYHRTVDELPRTNNSVEGWHRGFQARVSASHPIIWKFIDVLKNSHSLNRVNILQAVNGHAAPPQQKTYKDCNARILTIVDDFPNQQVHNYIRAIAHNLAF